MAAGARTHTVGSDLALHGLAYLGVLLLFVGAFGLVAFAFGDVAQGARPVAELAIAASPFAAAALLLRRGAHVAGRALELSGGLLLPTMLVTSFLDGVPVPPDLVGPALAVTLTAVMSACGLAYWLWSRAHRQSALRYLVAPMAWLAVALATMGVGQPIPSGKDVASASAAQVAAVSAAIVVSLALARWRRTAPLAAPTMTSAATGTVVVGLLALLTWYAEDCPPVAVAVTGVMGVLLLELLDVRVPASVLEVLELAWWTAVGLALTISLGPGPAALAAAAGFVALIERLAARTAATAVLLLASGCLVASLALAFAEPWWAFAAVTGVALWAHVRRIVPLPGVPSSDRLADAAAGILPAGAVAALALATDDRALALVVASGLVLLATVPATYPVLRRDAADEFWTLWWRMAAAIVVALVAVAQAQTAALEQRDLIARSVVLSVICLATALGPVSRTLRPWLTLGLAGWAWVAVCDLLGATAATTSVPIALVALGAVLVAHVDRRLDTSTAASLGWAGHALGVAAIGLTDLGWSSAVAVALSTIGWLMTSVADARDRSPLTAVLTAGNVQVRYVPWVMVAIGLPGTAFLALNAAGLVHGATTWASAVAVATALAYAAASRLPLGPRGVAVTTWSACAAAILAPVLAVEPWPAAGGLLALILTTIILPTAHRPRAMGWLAWSAIAPMIGLAAVQVFDAAAPLSNAQAASVTLVTVGGILAFGSALADLPGRRWLPTWRPRRESLLAPWVIGGAEVVVGTAMAWVAVPDSARGWLTIGAATILLGVGVVMRIGLLGGVSAFLSWAGILAITDATVLEFVWIAPAATAVLLLAADILGRLTSESRWWARWDVAIFAVAHVTAATSLVAAIGTGHAAAIMMIIGAMAIAVAVRMRSVTWVALVYAGGGVLLVLAGAALFGPGWLALTLACLSAALTALAFVAHGPIRWAAQVMGAAAALCAWLALVRWLAWTQQLGVDATCLGAAILVVVIAGLIRGGLLDRSWGITWGGVASLSVVAGVLLADVPFDGGQPFAAVGWPTVLAPALLGAGWVVAARPMALDWLRELSAVALLVAEAQWLLMPGASAWSRVALLTTTSLAAALATAVLARRGEPGPWLRPTVVVGVATTIGAVVAGASTSSPPHLVVPALLAAAVQAAVLGTAFQSTLVRAASPLLAYVAWLAFAGQALAGNAQWYTVPLGGALLLAVGIVRHDARAKHRDPRGGIVVPLELLGVAFLVGAALMQAVVDSLAYAAIAIAIGAGVAGWGAVTRVRRRVVYGAVVVVIAVVELIAVPLVRLLPAMGSVGVWILIAAVGLLAIGAATLLEASRAAVRKVAAGFTESTRGWE